MQSTNAADLLAQIRVHGAVPRYVAIISTSGEQRISNFLLWQLAYSELFLSPVLWPDFTRAELFAAISAFQLRERRFGRVSA